MFFRKALLLFSAALFLHLFTNAQCGRTDITADMGFKVRAVHIKARYVPADLQQQVEATIRVGETFDPMNLSNAQQVVSK